MKSSSVHTYEGALDREDLRDSSPRKARATAAILACYSIVGGLITFIGWAFDIYPFTDWNSDGITMKANPSVSAIAGGVAAVVMAFPRAERDVRLKWFVRVLAGFVALIGGMTIFQHLTGVSLHIDTLLIAEPAGAKATAAPGRMGMPASTCFLFSGLALTLLTGNARSVRMAFWFGWLVIAYTSLCLIGYWYGASTLYTLPKLTAISLQMATILCAEGVAILLLSHLRLPGTAAMRQDPGRAMLWRLVPPVIVVPLVLGALRLEGEEHGLFDSRFGTAALVFLVIVTLCIILWWTAKQLSLSFRERVAAQTARQESEDRLRVTNEKMVQSERAARVQAEKIAEQKDQFLATVSHELRTPLHAILGWTQLLRRGGLDPDKLAKGMEIIERNARAQGDLISDLLDLSRIISGKLRLEMQPVDLTAVIGNAIDSLRPAAEGKGLLLEVSLDPAVRPLEGDPTRIQQFVWNLLSNAIKFTDQGGRVAVRVKSVSEFVEIEVTDTGKGIKTEFLPHLFERFSQEDSSVTRSHGGMGIGLSLVKQLVELHGGKVQAFSDGEGKGARFTVQLPCSYTPCDKTATVSQDPNLQRHSSANGTSAQLPNLKGLKILLVDDEPDARETIRQILVDHKGMVVTARSAEEAMQLLAPDPPDVLISDIGMPRMDGYTMLRRMRASGHLMPAIALTAFATTDDRARALAVGYQAHLTKPVDLAELFAILQTIVLQNANQPAL